MKDTLANSPHLSTILWANVLMGIWVILSPFVLGFNHNIAAVGSNIATGVLIIVVAVASGWENKSLPATMVPLGVWLYVSPLVLNFSHWAYFASNFIMAFAVIVAAAAAEGLRSPPRVSSR